LPKEPDGVISEEPEVSSDPHEPEPSPDGSEKGKTASKQKDETTELRKELEALRKTNRELDENARYWSDQARGKKVDPDPDPNLEDESPLEEEEDPELADDSTDKLIDDFSKKGLEALVRRGVLIKKNAREMIQKEAGKIAREIVALERGKMTRDANLVGTYPDLQNPESELFKETQKLYQAAVKKEPEARKSVLTLELCAQAAKAGLDAKRPSREEDDRLSRVRAQSGDHGRRRSAEFEEPEDAMPPQAREIMKSFEQAGYEVTEENYKAHMPRRNGGRR